MSLPFKISLGANITLSVLVALLAWQNRFAATLRSATPVQPAARPSPRPEALAATAQAAEHPPEAARSKLTPAVFAQFERLGISRDIVIDALLTDFDNRSTRRLVELQKKYAPRLVPDREMLEFSRQNEAARLRELKDALGEEGYLTWDKAQTLRELNSARPPGDELPMSAEEAEQAYRLQKDFDEKNRELMEAMQDGVGDQADIGQLQAEAQESLDQGLEKLLGPERLAQLRGKLDSTTEVYRTFGDLNPSAAQAQAVVQVEAEYRDRETALAQGTGGDPAQAAKLSTDLKALSDAREANLRRIFGAEAYENLQRQNDPTYKTLRQYAGTWKLKTEELESVYDALHAFDRQAERLRTAAQMSEMAGQPVNWQAIETEIDQTRQHTETSLRTLIGEERLSRLKQTGLLPTR